MANMKKIFFKFPVITILLSVFMVVWFFTIQDRVLDSFFNIRSALYHEENEILFASLLVFSHANLIHLFGNVFAFLGTGILIEDILYTKFQYILLLLTTIIFSILFINFVSVGIGFSIVGMAILGSLLVSFYPKMRDKLDIWLIVVMVVFVASIVLQVGVDACVLLYGSDCSMIPMLEVVFQGSLENYTSDSAKGHISGFIFGLVFGGLIEIKEYWS